MTVHNSYGEANKVNDLPLLVGYEEEAPVKTKQQLMEQQLQELYEFEFPVSMAPDEDPTGRLAYLDVCKQLHGMSFMKFPTSSVASALCAGKEALYLDFFPLGRKGSIALAAAIKVNLAIKSISLVGCQITPMGAMEIARCLSETRTVTTLDLSQNMLWVHDPEEDVQGGVVVAEFLRPGNVLKSLSLRDNRLNDQHIAQFSEAAIDNTEVSCLDLSFNRIGYLGAIEITHIISHNADLQEVNLEWNEFQTMGSRQILGEGLLLNNTIKRFNLSWNGLDDICAQLVGRIIGENAIEEIIIAHNKIGPSGAEAIAKGLLATSALTVLILDDNPLQNEGCAALLRVAGNVSTLKHLSLQHCRCDAQLVEEAERIADEVQQGLVIQISETCCSNESMWCGMIDRIEAILNRLTAFSSEPEALKDAVDLRNAAADMELTDSVPIFPETCVSLCVDLLENSPPYSVTVQSVLMLLSRCCMQEENRGIANRFGIFGLCVILLRDHEGMSQETLFAIFDLISTLSMGDGTARQMMRPSIPYVLEVMRRHTDSLQLVFGGTVAISTLVMLDTANAVLAVEQGCVQILISAFARAHKRRKQLLCQRASSSLQSRGRIEEMLLCDNVIRWTCDALQKIIRAPSPVVDEKLRTADFGSYGTSVKIDELKWKLKFDRLKALSSFQ